MMWVNTLCSKTSDKKGASDDEAAPHDVQPDHVVDWSEGVRVRPDQILAEAILGAGPSKDKATKPTQSQIRHSFLMTAELDVETLKSRAKSCELSIHKSVMARDEVGNQLLTHSLIHTLTHSTDR